MSVVKFFVLLMYNIYVIQCSRNKYCDICVNHTLCIYTVPGPSKQCDKYEPSPLSSTEKSEIVNRINERRQFVAMGKLHSFPQAANMNKITWSTELANIAQRWADQCDRSVKPDKEDQCRDIVNVRVGQNIATVVGPSPGLSVRSMVDMWFMQNIFFTGSVTYYNHSSSTKTNYFTQLIWAETVFVGCGKVKFYMEPLKTVLTRIVCNFAPRGNRDGKPIYIIGLPSTQCSHDAVPSSRMPGLCQRKRIPGTMFAVETSTVKSLLRILNLSNDSLKRELDPNDLKTANLNYSEDYLRNQKTRHTYLSNRYGAIKRDSFHIDPPIQSDNYKDHTHTPERGHSRMYHGHQTKKEAAYTFEPVKTYTEQNLRRNDYTKTSLPYLEINYRRNYMNAPMECTRRTHVNEHGCCSTSNQCVTNECTRCNNCQQHNCQQQQNPCLSMPCPPKPCQPSHQPHQNTICPCNVQQGCSTPVSQCGHSPKCPYLSSTCAIPTPLCGFRRSEEADSGKSTPPNYYDLFPNLEIKSDERKSSPDIQHHHKELNNDYPILRRRKDNDNNKQVTTLYDMSQNKARFLVIPDPYHNFDSSAREKRDSEEKTFKPFWQVDDFIYKRPTDLKSMRYTTWPNRKRKKGFHPQATFMTSTEPITITFENDRRVTEKYLSFDELMHLRKFNDEGVLFYDAVRQGKAGENATSAKPPGANNTRNAPPAKALPLNTTKAPGKITKKATVTVVKTTVAPIATLTITANTPFIRVTSCTRKLTCTWTLQYMPIGGGGPSGSNGPNGLNGDQERVGTPPGYVDGCTRTSTCTRPHVNRNQWDTPKSDNEEDAPEEILPGPGSGSGPGSGYDADEDYCERRDLNKRRRDLIKATTDRTIYVHEIGTTPLTKAPTLLKTSERPITRSETNESSITKNYSYIRFKRNYQGYEKLFKKSCFSNTAKLTTSTQQTYESSATTILSRKRKISSKCPCNGMESLQSTFWLSIYISIIILF